MLLTGNPRPDQINETVKRNVKNFVVGVCNNQSMRWPGYSCCMWVNGTPLRLVQGSKWEIGGGEIYCYHDPSSPTPSWVPGLLAALVQFFGLSGDASLKEKILDMAAKVAADVFQPVLQSYVIQSAQGAKVSRVAINMTTKVMAAECVEAEEDAENEEDPTFRAVWRTLSGEEVEIDLESQNWMAIEI